MSPSPAAGGRRRRTPTCNDNPPAPAGKRRRRNSTRTPEPSPATAWAFPVDVLLEIIARSDVRTLVRCAALCKRLRRDILSPAFLRRVTGGQDDNPANRIVPPRLLGYLHTYDKEKQDDEGAPPALFSLVHPDPATVPAAGSFSDHHLAPFISRSAAADLLARYEPVTSRCGLAVLRRRHITRRKWLERLSDMCVYNPMTGERTFFAYPEGYWKHYHLHLGDVFVLLTADDGIGCAFMLLLADLSGFQDSRGGVMKVQTMCSDTAGTWSPKTYAADAIRPWHRLEPRRDAVVVLRGGRLTLHWLASRCDVILTYDVATSKPGSIKLPAVPAGCSASKLHLGTSPADGRLRLLAVEGFVVSAWLLAAAGRGWELEAVIPIEKRLRSLCPEIAPGPVVLEFVSSGERSGVALLHLVLWSSSSCGWHIVLDVETREMRNIWGP